MPDEPLVTLAPLDDAEYADFAQRHVAEYVRQHVNAGEWTAEEAFVRAKEELAALLSGGLRQSDHVFFKAIGSDGTRVGWLWVSPSPTFLGDDRERKRWLSQITVEETLRRRGYGRAMLTAMHRWLATQGTEELWLRVYDWNEDARRLYAAMGYEIMRRFDTDAHLRKRLSMTADSADASSPSEQQRRNDNG